MIIKKLKSENQRLKHEFRTGKIHVETLIQRQYYDEKLNPKMEKFKLKIRAHFEKELEIKKSLYSIEDKIDSLSFDIFQTMKEKE